LELMMSDDLIERVAVAMRAEFVEEGRAGGNWSDSADTLTGCFGLDGNFDLDAVGRAAIEATGYATLEAALRTIQSAIPGYLKGEMSEHDFALLVLGATDSSIVNKALEGKK
jgi:hypothetical protein